MSVPQVITDLQTILAAVTNVANAPTTVPGSVDNSDLPMIITVPGPASWSGNEIHRRLSARLYVVKVLVQPVGQGLTSKAHTTLYGLLTAIGEALTTQGNQTLSTSGGYIAASEGGIADTGLVPVEWAGTFYHGAEFEVMVHEKG